jgi:hypothetical protein
MLTPRFRGLFKSIAISFLERREADSIQLKKLPSIHPRKGPAGAEEKASDQWEERT